MATLLSTFANFRKDTCSLGGQIEPWNEKKYECCDDFVAIEQVGKGVTQSELSVLGLINSTPAGVRSVLVGYGSVFAAYALRIREFSQELQLGLKAAPHGR